MQMRATDERVSIIKACFQLAERGERKTKVNVARLPLAPVSVNSNRRRLGATSKQFHRFAASEETVGATCEQFRPSAPYGCGTTILFDKNENNETQEVNQLKYKRTIILYSLYPEIKAGRLILRIFYTRKCLHMIRGYFFIAVNFPNYG